MTEDQIKRMVERFLTWRLPETFNPDGGISFKSDYNEHTAYPMKHEPVGTNLLTFTEAKALVLHMLDGMPGGSVIDEITAERKRQIDVEGWTPEHDDAHDSGEMALAAACYAAGKIEFSKTIFMNGRPWSVALFNLWPWSREWWKPKDRRRDLIRAAALIVAEIERLDRHDDVETCLACDKPFYADDMVLPDESGDYIHVACCGPEREGYTLNGEPLGPDDLIPTGFRWGDGVEPIDADRLREDREERDRFDREG